MTTTQKFIEQTEYMPEECSKMFVITCYIPKDGTGDVFYVADDEGAGTFADEVGADYLKVGLDETWEKFRKVLTERAEQQQIHSG